MHNLMSAKGAIVSAAHHAINATSATTPIIYASAVSILGFICCTSIRGFVLFVLQDKDLPFSLAFEHQFPVSYAGPVGHIG